MVFFSIIIPTFNSSSTIKRVIESIINQTYSNNEIWIIDGDSTDDTLQIIKSYQKEKKNIYFISEPDNGVYDAMNKGISLAKGKYLLFLGSDDALHNNEVLNSVHQQMQEKEIDITYGDVQIMGDVSWAKDGTIYAGEFTQERLFQQNICHQAIFYKRTAFEKIGLFNIRYRICADWDMNHRCFAKLKTSYIPVIVANFFTGGESTIRNHDSFTDHDFVLNLRNYYSISLFNRLFKGYSWVFLNVSDDCLKKKMYLKSIMFFFMAMYHSSSKKKTVYNFLSNIIITRRTQSAKSSN
jgi:glycosyltransferase involved in cell wall biosynthesis